jgi:hypothetical protein
MTTDDLPPKPERPPDDAPLAEKWKWMEELDEWKGLRAAKTKESEST